MHTPYASPQHDGRYESPTWAIRGASLRPGVTARRSGYVPSMQTKTIGQAGLRGWRASVADVVATPVAKRSGFNEDQIRAVIGGVFLALSLLYVMKAAKELISER